MQLKLLSFDFSNVLNLQQTNLVFLGGEEGEREGGWVRFLFMNKSLFLHKNNDDLEKA